MSEGPQASKQVNLWKLTTIGLLVVCATALVTGVVVAHYAGSERPSPAGVENQSLTQQTGNRPTQQGQPGSWSTDQNQLASAQQAPVEQPGQPQGQAAPVPPTPREEYRPSTAQGESPHPSAADIRACNRYANSASRNKTAETLSNALIGGALGAGLGAAGGAIAGGGGGAGKGAGIGGLVGAAAGTVYGLNKANQQDAHAAAAYRACMRRRGYVD